jgi:hypothetical protein
MSMRQKGGWWVTTPLYCGSVEDIAKAVICKHEHYSPKPARKEELLKDGVTEAVLEKCDACCAVRMRYKSDIEHEEKKS